MTNPTTPPTTPPVVPEPATGTPPAVPDADKDWKAESEKWQELSRKNEARARENKSAADELAAIKESQKTETQRNADRLAALEKEAATARSEALRYKIAAQYAISSEDAELFLTGADEAAMTAQAKRLTDREAERKKQGNFVPKEGANSTPGNASDLETVRSLFQGS